MVTAIAQMQPSEIVYMGQPPLRLDFMRAIDGVDTETVFAGAVCAKLDHVAIRMISLAHLIANKRTAGRPQDVIDADFLERMAKRKGSTLGP